MSETVAVTFSLKRCPFCNSHDLTADVTIITYAIRCVECGCLGPTSTKLNRAVWLWNGEYVRQNPSALIRNRKSNRDDRKQIDL